MEKNRIYNILKLLICLVFFFSLNDISSLILKLLNINSLSNKENVILQFILSLVLVLFTTILYINTIKKDYKKLKNNLSKNISLIIKYFIIFTILKYSVSFLSVIILTIFKYDTTNIISNNQNLIQEYIKASPILMFISVSFLGPYYEEILFRLSFKKVITNKYLYIIISGTLFGLLHIFPLSDGITLILGIIQSISYVVMGIYFSYVYYKTDNIFISMGLHLLNNLLSVIMMLNML